MNILIPDSWLREYLHTNATPKDIQHCLSLCGPSIERMHEKDGEIIYDIEVTTNRVDCMSVIGIAREAVAILPQFGFEAKLTNNPYSQTKKIQTAEKVEYLHTSIDQQLCSNFTTVLIKNISNATSPEWLAKKLNQVDMRPINVAVDITNYLMHTLGQPVHVFDYDKIANHTIKLRESKTGESVITLDQKSYTLSNHDIIIEDGDKNIIDLSGIMGGLNSSVDNATKNILLYVQIYEPTHIRKTSMNLAIRTTAASLFEKSLPTENVLPTLQMGIQLFKQLANGTVEKNILSISTPSPDKYVVQFTESITEFTNKLLGIELSKKEIKSILTNLEFIMLSDTQIQVPWYRYHDIQIPQDVVEEIARIYGYHNLPSTIMIGSIPKSIYSHRFSQISKMKSMLKYSGLTEVYSYSLVSQAAGLKIKNPLSSEWAYLRTSILPSHQTIIKENLGRVEEIKIFEIANVYLPEKNTLPKEQPHLAISSTNKDKRHLKGLIEALMLDSGLPMQSITIEEFTDSIGCEIDLLPLLENANLNKTFTPISKFSPIIEDINLQLSQPYPSLVHKIKAVSPLIDKVEFKDFYEGKLTLRIYFHSNDKQLSVEDIASIRTILSNLD